MASESARRAGARGVLGRSSSLIGRRVRSVAEWLRAPARVAASNPGWPLYSALALTLAAVAETVVYAGAFTTSDASISLVLGVIATMPLAFRRTHLGAVAAVVTPAALSLIVLEQMTLTASALIGQLWVLYLLGATRRRTVTIPLGIPFLLVGFADRGIPGATFLVLAIAALALGDARRLRGEALEERDATRRALVGVQREQAVLDERARIARELHDVVAHHVSAIAVQAEAGRLTTAHLPPEGVERFQAIGDAARDALTEMRQIVGVLRDGDDNAAARQPQPGLAQLAELLDAARAGGTPVELTVTGVPIAVSASIDLAAYRVIQEALANVRRHAPAASARVHLAHTEDTLRIRVSDDGDARTGTARNAGSIKGGSSTDAVLEGYGLIGMRERASVFGGTVVAGPAPGAGFIVDVTLPLQGTSL